MVRRRYFGGTKGSRKIIKEILNDPQRFDWIGGKELFIWHATKARGYHWRYTVIIGEVDLELLNRSNELHMICEGEDVRRAYEIIKAYKVQNPK